MKAEKLVFGEVKISGHKISPMDPMAYLLLAFLGILASSVKLLVKLKASWRSNQAWCFDLRFGLTLCQHYDKEISHHQAICFNNLYNRIPFWEHGDFPFFLCKQHLIQLLVWLGGLELGGLKSWDRDCYWGVQRFESQTTGPQSINSIYNTMSPPKPMKNKGFKATWRSGYLP